MTEFTAEKTSSSSEPAGVDLRTLITEAQRHSNSHASEPRHPASSADEHQDQHRAQRSDRTRDDSRDRSRSRGRGVDRDRSSSRTARHRSRTPIDSRLDLGSRSSADARHSKAGHRSPDNGLQSGLQSASARVREAERADSLERGRARRRSDRSESRHERSPDHPARHEDRRNQGSGYSTGGRQIGDRERNYDRQYSPERGDGSRRNGSGHGGARTSSRSRSPYARQRYSGDNYSTNNEPPRGRRRQSPTYDNYQPQRRNNDRDSYGGGGDGHGRSRDGESVRGPGGDYAGRPADSTQDYNDRGDNRPYRGGRRAQDAMPEFSDSRREKRNAVAFSIWAPSPTEEELRNRSISPDREVKKTAKSKNKRHESDTESDSDDSAADRRRRRKSSKKSKDKRSSKSRHRSRDSHRKSKRHSSGRRRRSPSPNDRISAGGDKSLDHAENVQDVVKPSSANAFADLEFTDDMWVEKKVEMNDDDQEVGPAPMFVNDGRLNERSYGGALLAGEGSAMAAYVQDGKRIPRRGEIGLESDQIELYENVGFVMSGSRHQRMNAVRVRKENQVISAEEKRALMIFNQEEKIKKDNKIINEMREMVASKMRSTGHSV